MNKYRYKTGLLTMRSHAQGRDQHQRVGDAVRRQQQRQLVQDESPQISVRGRG